MMIVKAWLQIELLFPGLAHEVLATLTLGKGPTCIKFLRSSCCQLFLQQSALAF